MLTRIWIFLLSLIGRDPRGLFRFYDGKRWRSVDPLEAARAFFTLPTFDWDETPEMLKTGQAMTQLQTLQKIAVAVREVFGIKSTSEGGLSELGCFHLFIAFRGFLGNVKKNGSLIQISPEFTDSGLLDPSEIPPRPGSGSGSTLTAPSPVQPGSPAEPITAG